MLNVVSTEQSTATLATLNDVEMLHVVDRTVLVRYENTNGWRGSLAGQVTAQAVEGVAGQKRRQAP